MSKIVIVDDSKLIRELMKTTLSRYHYEFIVCEDGTSAYRVFEKFEKVSLLICDLNMPDMTGLDLIKKIREFPEYRKLPVFVLTTESSQEFQQTAIELGVLTWILKPFKPEALFAVIEKVLKTHEKKD
jgi:two-component system, chemotaxis family, chemotaxis protein CheY